MTTTIRSYRRVFDLERRIYVIDRVRLNPNGVPVRSIVYAIVLLIASLAASRLPVIGAVVGLLPWYVRDVAGPCALAALATVLEIEGRSFPHAARALVRHSLAPGTLDGLRPAEAREGRWVPPPLLVVPDGCDARARRVRYRGPGVVRISVPHERRLRRRLLSRGERVVLVLGGTHPPAGDAVVAVRRRDRLEVVHTGRGRE